PVSLGDGDTQSDQERSGWKDRYQAFDECHSKKGQDTTSGEPRKQISEGSIVSVLGFTSKQWTEVMREPRFSSNGQLFWSFYPSLLWKVSALASSPARHRSKC